MNENNIFCPSCKSKEIIKTGKRANKYQKVQRYRCKDCKENFITKKIIKKTYPARIILNSISYYNLGYSQQQTSKLISKKHKIKVPQKTLSNWINEYKPITTFHKLRTKATKLYNPIEIIFEQPLQHKQIYIFKYHKAKLELLFKDIKYNNQFTNLSKFYQPIKSYLEKIPSSKFPHHIFKEKTSGSDAEIAKLKNIKSKKIIEQRASQLKFPHLKITHLSKNNLANKLAKLAINLAKSNKDRYNAIQNFMLINDSTTIATEIPVYLTNADIKYFLKKGFTLDFNQNKNSIKNNAITALEQRKSAKTLGANAEVARNNLVKNYKTPITGHIDILQVRNGLIHILDYKPEASKTNPIEQLTIYALALASRTKLDLHSFKCAWFDEDNYYEFFPLHAVYEKRKI